MAVSKTAQLAIAGVAVVVVIVVALMFFKPAGDSENLGDSEKPMVVEREVFLKNDPVNGGCLIQTEPESITVADSRQVVWVIDHTGCDDKQELVTVGNFRRSDGKPGSDCREAQHTSDGIWLFAQPEALQHRQSNTRIQLTTKGRDALAEGTYYYDICAGKNADKMTDPMLVIEY